MFKNKKAKVFVPDGNEESVALRRTTHLAIGAHPDDNEIMAVEGIIHCYQHPGLWFCGVVLTDGRSAPRIGSFANMDDSELSSVRYQELINVSRIGAYAAQVMLDYNSEQVKTTGNQDLMDDLLNLFTLTQPQVIYTHNLADRHPTHVATAVRVINALRHLPLEKLPQEVYGCEVWRDLDWLPQGRKHRLDCSSLVELQDALLKVFVSQNNGGKQYDTGAMSRRVAHATFDEAHMINSASHLSFAMDLMPLITHPEIDIAEFTLNHIDVFREEVGQLLKTVS